MPQFINTNVASLNTQRALNTSQSALQTSLQRLSSGLRINSAKDDAAGLAISERFTTQIRGLNQAIRNANDGVSFAQTAEGALSTVGDNLQRIRELAVQSVNDTNSASDRQALNNEVSQLIAEINRVSSATQFNGQNILDGSLSTLTFQVGANQGQTIQVDGVDSRGSQLGEETFTGTSFLQGDLPVTDDIELNGTAVSMAGVTTGEGVVDAINLVAADSGVSARQSSTTSVDTGAYTAPSGAAETITINGVDITLADGADIDAATSAINDASNQTGVTATNDGTNITLSNTSGADIDVTDDTSFASIGATLETYEAGIILSTDIGDTITTAGTDVADLGLGAAGALTTSSDILNNVNVLTGQNASDALSTIDAALSQVSGLRSELGAVQIRFETTISNLQVSTENLSAARSRIQDTDFAAETAELTRNQILQQAGIAMLSQANAAPQNVLALLQ
jgi:flagellin